MTPAKQLWKSFLDLFSDNEDANEPIYDPVHLAAMVMIVIFAVGVLFWLLWTLLVFEGGFFRKVMPALQVLFTGKTLADYGWVGYPYEMGIFEGFIANTLALVLTIAAICGVWWIFTKESCPVAFKFSRRFAKLPPYPFAEIDRKKKKAIAEGKDIISFGVGDPDQPTPKHIVEAAKIALDNPKFHHYPFDAGLADFRKAVAQWCASRFGILLNADTQVRSCIGSKDGISHAHFTLVNPGDIVLMPNPGYPVYNTSSIFTDGKPYALPLKEKNKFLPDLDAVPAGILKKTKVLFLNSPSNPTAAVANAAFFENAIRLAKKYKFIIIHDAAYSEIYFEKPPISFLSVPGAMDVGVEYHSFSKTYNMTGWRLGWYCGNAEIVGALGKTKENFDSGAFEAVQMAGVAALTGSQNCVSDMRRLYKERRDLLCGGLKQLGWRLTVPEASFYVWVQTPKGYSSVATVEKLIEEASIVTIPGSALGKNGEGYIRFALTVPKERIEAALQRLSKVRW